MPRILQALTAITGLLFIVIICYSAYLNVMAMTGGAR